MTAARPSLSALLLAAALCAFVLATLQSIRPSPSATPKDDLHRREPPPREKNERRTKEEEEEETFSRRFVGALLLLGRGSPLQHRARPLPRHAPSRGSFYRGRRSPTRPLYRDDAGGVRQGNAWHDPRRRVRVFRINFLARCFDYICFPFLFRCANNLTLPME